MARFKLSAIILISTVLSGMAEIAVPDFAFPQIVIEHSDSSLKANLKSGNQPAVLRDMLDLCVAKGLIGERDSEKKNLELLDSLTIRLTGIYKHIGFLMQASLLQQYFLNNKNLYDSRPSPILTETMEDDNEFWSGTQYRKKITSLIDSATNIPEKVGTENIRAIDHLLNENKLSFNNLNINDFIYIKSLQILQSIEIEDPEEIIPFFPSVKTEDRNDEDLKSRIISLIDRLENSEIEPVRAWGFIQESNLFTGEKRFDFLWNLALKNKNHLEAGYYLWEIYKTGNVINSNLAKEVYNEIKSWLKRFPSFPVSDSLKGAVSAMSEQKIEVELPGLILPEKMIRGEATLHNLEKGYLLIYELKSSDLDAKGEVVLKRINATSTPSRVVELSTAGEKPFENKIDFEVQGLKPGLYIAIPSLSKKLNKGWYKERNDFRCPTFRVTDISILSLIDNNEEDSGRIYVVDARSQKPLSGAKVFWKRNGKKEGSGITASDGSIRIPEGYFSIEASYKGSTATLESGFHYYPEKENTALYANILTDLNIYRPGDTIKFAVVGWQEKSFQKSLLKDKEVKIIFRDAGYQVIDSKDVILDCDGRTEGRFEIPQDRMLGTYHLLAQYPETQGLNSGSADIEVSEYTVPSFQVTLEQKKGEKEIIEIDGEAVTYSGMPLINSSVEISVKFLGWNRWFGGNTGGVYNTTTTTGSDGKFSLSLPTDGLKDSKYATGRYMIIASVIDHSGNRVDSKPLLFYLGNDFSLNPVIKEKTEVKGESIQFKVNVFSVSGLPEKTTVEYKISPASFNLMPSDTLTGIFESPFLNIPSELMPSGDYSLKFRISGENDWLERETVIFRPEENRTPYPTPLWLPVTEIVYENSANNVEIKFGNYYPYSYIMAVVSDNKGIIQRQWVKTDTILSTLKIDLPEGGEELYINFSGMHDFITKTGRVTLVPQTRRDKLSIESESFREKAQGGEEEIWKFRVKYTGKGLAGVSLFAVMTDKALNALKDFRWNLNTIGRQPYCHTRVFGVPYSNIYSYKIISANQNYNNWSFQVPDWQTYGYPLAGYLQINRPVMFKSAMVTREMGATTGRENSDETNFETEDVVADNSIETETEEVRPVEMPVAFFLSDLKSEDNGETIIKFRMPDFNTTWQFQLAGYTSDLKSDVMVKDVTVSKPVMIKANMPRYLRTGDIAEIAATIFNNSENPRNIDGEFILKSDYGTKILKKEKYENLIVAPGENRIISIKLKVPESTTPLRLEVYARSEGNSDGEGGEIQILPSSTPVLESNSFYLATKDEAFSMKLPRYPSGSEVLFKYNDNPLWEVIASLPALTENSDGSVLSIAKSLYANLTGARIIAGNERIRSRINSLNSKAEMSVNLLQDEEFKNVGLASTPWLEAAQSERNVIESLIKYDEKDKIFKTNQELMYKLKSLQTASGGWLWFEGMKPSSYITMRIVGILSLLKNDESMPQELDNNIRKAITYLDSYFVENREKGGSLNVSEFLDYLYIRRNFDIKLKKDFSKIEQECFDSIKKQWKKWGIIEKAKAASVLYQRQGKNAETDQILKSIKEYVIKDNLNGWNFGRQNRTNSLYAESVALETLYEITQDSLYIEGLRQWLILEKETQDWRFDPQSVEVINTIMKTGSIQSEVSRRMPEILIGGKRIELPENDWEGGNLSLNLDAVKVSGKNLEIKREPGLPAWGGLISKKIMPIREVKSTETEGISVTKGIYKKDDSGRLLKVTKCKKGDKITVVIQLNVSKGMDYVAITDERGACMRPDSFLSGMKFEDSLPMYREIGLSKTSYFIEHLPEGKYTFSYECFADRAGEYSVGITTVQSLYAPSKTSHSEGKIINVEE